MHLKIEPLHDKNRNCLEDNIATILNFLGESCELLYVLSWNFEFLPQYLYTTNSLGRRMYVDEKCTWQSLNIFYGIKPKYYKLSKLTQIYDIVNSSIDYGIPLLLQVDAYDLPWADAYRRYHILHYCIISGYENSKNNFLCLDPYINGKINLLNVEALNMNSKVIMLTKNKVFISERDIVSAFINQIKANMFSNIRNFAYEIKYNFDIIDEVNNIKHLYLVPFFMQLHCLNSIRQNLSKMFKYLGDRYDIEYHRISYEMKNSYLQWQKVKKTFIAIGNGTYQNDRKYYDYCSNLLYDIAKHEEKIAQDIKCIFEKKYIL